MGASESLSPLPPHHYTVGENSLFYLPNRSHTPRVFFMIEGSVQKNASLQPGQGEVLWFECGHLGRKASVSDSVACLESRPSFSFQAQTPREATITLQTEQRSQLPGVFTHEVAPPSQHHLKCTFWPSAKGTFVFLMKGKHVPTERGLLCHPSGFKHASPFSVPHLLSSAGSNELSPSQLSPPFPHGYLYPEYLPSLIHWTILSLILKGHLQVILSRKLS